tara:strand:- start:10721 stop:12205 length:1485 start_codon:yes stop_codon:yes gene_type:complete
MSHDLYASWATSELANKYKNDATECFLDEPQSEFEIFANRESGRNWPIPDGRLSLDYQNNRYEIALELKRVNEGVHGILTAIGQSQAYIHPQKGYSASVIVIPREYTSHNRPGDYIQEVLNNVNPNLPIGIYSYDQPDSSATSPFRDKLLCHRSININFDDFLRPNTSLSGQKSNTQWAHLREGSSEPDAFFRYLQCAKTLNANILTEPILNVPEELIDAVQRKSPGANPLKYLTYSSGDIFHDVVWRTFWLKYILTDEVSKMYNIIGGNYNVNDVPTKLKHINGRDWKKFFSGRVDSIKNKLVRRLNADEITEHQAWEAFALNIRNRAHSYREDIDSSLEHLGFLESDGKPSELGYKFVDSCERGGDSSSGTPKLILGSTFLKNGGLGAFLHYVYKLSEGRLKNTPLEFSANNPARNNRLEFQQVDYLNWIKQELATNLKVMNTAALRGGVERKPFQAELSILRKFNFVSKFRIGLGLEINWPLVQEYLDYNI